jgi:hypothetical protein
LAQRGSRKKRKARRRGRERQPAAREGQPARREEQPAAPQESSSGDAMARGYSRSRRRDEEARATLEPLRKGERPRAVTVGAIVALLLAAANLVSWLAGIEVQGDKPAFAGVAVYSGLMLLTAWGMWRAKYWAVLGMHALLALIILVFAVLAVRAENVGELGLALGIILAAGTLFWFLVKAMARIQMPPRPGTRS